MKTILFFISSFIAFLSVLFLLNPASENFSSRQPAETPAVEKAYPSLNNGDTTWLLDDISSGNLQSSDYIEGVPGVYFVCLNNNGVPSYKLGFISDDAEYVYCRVESQNGKLDNPIIKKLASVGYSVDSQHIQADGFADKLHIKYYDENDKVLGFQDKYIYWDELNHCLYAVNMP